MVTSLSTYLLIATFLLITCTSYFHFKTTIRPLLSRRKKRSKRDPTQRMDTFLAQPARILQRSISEDVLNASDAAVSGRVNILATPTTTPTPPSRQSRRSSLPKCLDFEDLKRSCNSKITRFRGTLKVLFYKHISCVFLLYKLHILTLFNMSLHLTLYIRYRENIDLLSYDFKVTCSPTHLHNDYF